MPIGKIAQSCVTRWKELRLCNTKDETGFCCLYFVSQQSYACLFKRKSHWSKLRVISRSMCIGLQPYTIFLTCPLLDGKILRGFCCLKLINYPCLIIIQDLLTWLSRYNCTSIWVPWTLFRSLSVTFFITWTYTCIATQCFTCRQLQVKKIKH